MSYLDKIDRYCDQHMMKQSRFEREAGLSKGLISRWRTGTVPRIDSLQKVADYLTITMDDLMSPDASDLTAGRPFLDSWSSAPDVVRDSSLRYIPVYRYISPGSASDALPEVLTHFPVLPDNLPSAEECFGLIIRDSSMSPEIEPGDIAVVRNDPEPASGDIVIVSVPGSDTMCRRLIRRSDCLILQPFSRHFDPEVYRTEEVDLLPVIFTGKVVAVIKPVNSSSDSIPEM